MYRVSIAGRHYSDPDVLSFIIASGGSGDPRQEVIRKARQLNRKLCSFGGPIVNPRQRMELLASLAGIKIEHTIRAHALSRDSSREALIVHEPDGSRRIVYDPSYPDTRINFTIAHEISHTFFPEAGGARFRGMCDQDSREANELERLCDLGAAELLMPSEEFEQAANGRFGLKIVATLATRFGSSVEATVYRLATAYDGVAIAGLLRHRLRKGERRLECTQQYLFDHDTDDQKRAPKYRRQSLHLSLGCDAAHHIPWNKSFDEKSCVYRITKPGEIVSAQEVLPNQSHKLGTIEAMLAPFQRPNEESLRGDVLFVWYLHAPKRRSQIATRIARRPTRS